MIVLFKSKILAKYASKKENCNAILKVMKVLGKWPGLKGGNWTQRWCELFPPEVMLRVKRKDGVSCSWKLDSRYDYLGVSCSVTCDV